MNICLAFRSGLSRHSSFMRLPSTEARIVLSLQSTKFLLERPKRVQVYKLTQNGKCLKPTYLPNGSFDYAGFRIRLSAKSYSSQNNQYLSIIRRAPKKSAQQISAVRPVTTFTDVHRPHPRTAPTMALELARPTARCLQSALTF